MKRPLTIIPALLLIYSFVVAQWDWQYPLPQGNTLNDMVFASGTNTGYAVGNNGVILKTTDRGFNWVLLDSATTVRLNGLAVVNETTAYAVGENGVCLRTTNGSTWEQMESGTHYHLKGIDFPTPEKGCIVGYKGLILKKINENWEEAESPTNFTLYDVFFPTPDVGVAIGDSGTIVRTTDGGSTWNKINNPHELSFNDVFFPSANIGFITGQKGIILKTTDGGATWNDISYSQVESNLLSVHFYDDSNGYVTGANGVILSTTVGGSSWLYKEKSTTLSFNEVIMLDPFIPQDTTFICDTILICSDYGAILRSDSCLASLINVTGGNQQTISSMTFMNENMGFAIGGDPFNNKPLILKTDDGKTWQNITFDTIKRYITEIDLINDTLGYISAKGGLVFKYFGDSVLPIKTGYFDHLYSIKVFDTNTVYAAGLNGTLIKTVSADTTWNQLDVPVENHLYSMYFFNKNNGYVVGDHGTLLRIRNGGNQIKKINTGVDNPLYDVHFIDEDKGFVVGYDGKILKITVNGGTETITPIPSGVNYPLNAVYFPEPDIGYIAGENGLILKSTDGGDTWYPQYTGTTNGLRALAFFNSETGYTAGAGKSILKTNNGGGPVILPGIAEKRTFNYDINLYPNPAKNQVWIEFTLEDRKRVKISCFDMTGREIATIADMTHHSGQVKYSFDVSAVSKGIYLLIVEVDKSRSAEKLIITR